MRRKGGQDSVSHNTWSYQRNRCHDGPGGRPCDVCRAAAAAYSKRQYHKRVARLKADPSIRPHGDPQTYNVWGCRCRPCSDAASRHQRELRQRKRPGIELNIFKVRPYKPKPTTKPFGREWLNDSVQS